MSIGVYSVFMPTLLEIKNVSKAYFQQPLFNAASLTIAEKQKIGVIGRNGAGKSTLFKIILGIEEPDSGSVLLHDRARLGYLEQHDTPDLSQTVLAHLEHTTLRPEWECAKMAAKFDLTPDKLSQPLSALSGGYQMRVKLTSLLLKDPNLFLLDEPTNYLDVHTQLLLERALISYSGAFLIISHDREFLARTCDQTLEVENEQLFLYPGPVNDYFEYKKEQLLMKQRYNKKIEREQEHLQAFIDRFRYKATKAAQAQSKMKALAKLKTLDIADPLARVRITIPAVEPKKGIGFSCHKLAIGYGDKIVASGSTFDIDRGAKVAIVGDNGQGKTTLLKTLVGELPQIDGTFRWGHGSTISYYAQHVASRLPLSMFVLEYLRSCSDGTLPEETILQMAGNFLFKDSALEKKISVLSGGERARLCLAGLLLSKRNVLILDEPTNHLDFETVEALSRALAEFAGTVFFISHNRTFVNNLATAIVEVNNGEIKKFPDSYENYIAFLENSLDPNEPAVSKPIHPTPITSGKEKYEAAKLHKKKIQACEETIKDLTHQRDLLLARQIKKPGTFSPADYENLGKIMTELQTAEETWLTLSL